MEDSFLSALEAVGKFVFIYQKHRGNILHKPLSIVFENIQHSWFYNETMLTQNLTKFCI